jgi:fructokinase
VYVTIGTGVGGGVYAEGKLLHGLVHPELGHMLLRPHPEDPNPRGVCPYHEGCMEGLAAGPAIGARVNGDARLLPDDHPTFAIEAYYLAQMCVNLILTLSPEKIILGGGVLGRECLLPMVRKETLRLLGGYVQSPAILEDIDHYIVAPELFPVSGLVGSFLLGKQALLEADRS